MLPRITIQSINFLGKELSTTDTVKDLGITLQIDNLGSDRMHKLCMINGIHHLFDKSTLLTFINALVFSNIFYCSSVWSGTSKGKVNKLLIQNFTTKMVLGKRKYDHITSTH